MIPTWGEDLWYFLYYYYIYDHYSVPKDNLTQIIYGRGVSIYKIMKKKAKQKDMDKQYKENN